MNTHRKKAAGVLPAERYVRRCPPAKAPVEDDRTGESVETLKRAIADNLYFVVGKNERFATPHDLYLALAYTVRDRLIHRWIRSVEAHLLGNAETKIVCYLSAEYLMGRQLRNNLINAGLWKNAQEALAKADLDLFDLMEQEPDPGLGNGGLGRLAACFMDSLATLDIPAVGFGIRYEFGIFEQAIRDGWQVERPDKWLRLGNPWELERPERTVPVYFGGHTLQEQGADGNLRVRWVPERTVLGTPYDTLVPGYHTNTVNTLRLWSAGSSREFDFQVFNAGDYTRAVADKTYSENISKVLYPNDESVQGKELRLQQQYFFVSCSLQDVLRFYTLRGGDLRALSERVAIQLNDTHPAVAVPELVRLLVDEHGLPWEAAWDVTRKTLAYTNHTLLPEALEAWPVGLFGRLLPRHLEIVYEINRRFLEEVRVRFPGDEERVARMSLIEEGDVRRVRMANLACVGSHAVNGVAALHTELVKTRLLADFHELWPDKFSNKTNGVTPRRWLLGCNPKLSLLITDRIGREWTTDLDALAALEAHAGNKAFVKEWQAVKLENKGDLAEYILHETGIDVPETSLFDVQVKRIHEYKRQSLFCLYMIALYLRLKRDPGLKMTPRVCIVGGKAAPGYWMAKLLIKLVSSIGDVVNRDPDVGDRLRVVFLPNFSVTVGERVYPAAELSEQISMAGKEASGTGNMKFALNGALTIGTLDGANIEIRDAVGADNFFLFGNTVDDIDRLRTEGYRPREYYEKSEELRAVLDALADGCFSGGDRDRFRPLVDQLLSDDPYMLCADFDDYLRGQDRAAERYRDAAAWTRMSILNTARVGRFSSDRTIREYCRDIWHARPCPVEIGPYDPEKAGLRPVRRGKEA